MATRTLLSLMFIVLFSSIYGQSSNPFINDATGRPLYLNTSYRIEGTPYFPDGYQLADVIAANGKIYHNIRVKVNLVENQVLYLDEAQKEMIASLPVSRVKFLNYVNEDGSMRNVTIAGYPEALNKTGTAVFEVIDSGKISLLKNIKATYRDEKKYGDATITRSFSQTQSYYALLPGGVLKKLDKGKESILELFADKKNEVGRYIDEQGLKCRTLKEYIMVFQFYNSL